LLIENSYSIFDQAIMDWLKSHGDVNETLRSTFNFSQAEVTLISTVPGRVPLPALSLAEREWLYRNSQRDMDYNVGRPCDKCVLAASRLQASRIQYGSLRIKEVLQSWNKRYVLD
jgi:hypothetical protein